MDDKRLSVRQMLLMFVAGVAVCAVFFALGFLVGYNQRPVVATAETEQIQAPVAIPPAVNPPPDTSPASVSSTPANPHANTPGQPASSAAGQPDSQSASKSTEPQTEVIDSSTPSLTAKSSTKASPDSGLPASSAASAEAKPGNGFLLQVGALKSRQDAESQVEELNTRGYHHVSVMSPQDAHQGDSLWRVLVGPYETRRQAGQVRKRLAKAGYHPFFKR